MYAGAYPVSSGRRLTAHSASLFHPPLRRASKRFDLLDQSRAPRLLTVVRISTLWAHGLTQLRGCTRYLRHVLTSILCMTYT